MEWLRVTAVAALLAALGVFAACGSGGALGNDVAAMPDVAADRSDAGEGPAVPDGDLTTLPDMDAGLEPDAAAMADACPAGAMPGPGTVITTRGAVAGVKDGDTWAFKGIPYAAPPVGKLRWRPPEPPPCYQGVLEAKKYGPVCPQIDSKGAVIGAEDCLTLNLWTPVAERAVAPVPVMVFLHGGGNVQGSSSETIVPGKSIYDGRRLAERGRVVVTLNYRLGPLGFLALPGLSAESVRGVSGNYGILDQIAALQWVADNVAAFGGDPTRVMVFGESAGAVDTCTLLASPLAAGLFHAALMQSGGCTQPRLATAETAMWARVVQGSCGGDADLVACLRRLPAEQVVAELPGSIGVGNPSIGMDPAKYGPVVDGWVLVNSPLEAIRAGTHNRVPFAIGTNGEELAAMLTVKVATEEEFQTIVQTSFAVLGQSVVDQVLDAYPVSDYPSPQDALVALYSDMRFHCPARAIARAVAGTAGVPVWRYFFTRQAETKQGPKPAQHGVELFYLFGTAEDIPFVQVAPADRALSEAIMGYWTRFGATGDPNGDGAVPWPAYDAATDAYLRLDAPVLAGQGVRTPQCDLFDAMVGDAL